MILRCQMDRGNRGRDASRGLAPPPLGRQNCVRSHRKNYDSEGQMDRGNRGRDASRGLAPPPLGRQKCVRFYRKSYDSEVSDEVRQSGGWTF